MQEVVLPLCAAAGVAAALVLGRIRGGATPKPRTESDHLESERNILLKSISKLEKDSGYAAERDALLPAYKNRLAEIKAALAGKAHQGTAVPAKKEGGGGLSGAASGAAVGVADTAGSVAASQEGDAESGITSVPESAAKPATEYPKTDGLVPDGRSDAPAVTSQDAEPHPAPPKTGVDEGEEPRVGPGTDDGDGSDEDDLEKIKGDIARAISKLERAETE